MKLKAFSFVALLGAFMSPPIQANHLDFLVDGGSFTLMVDVSGIVTATDTSTGSAGNIVGTEREVSITADLGNVTASYNAPETAPDGPNPASMLAVTGSTDSLSTMFLLYNGIGAAGLGGLNFDAAWDLIRIDFPTIDGALDLRLTAADTDGDSGTASLGGITTGGLYDFRFNDPDYTNFNVDFTRLDSLRLDIETIDPGTSYSVNSLTREVVIPEPSAGILAIAGIVGLSLCRRRNRD